ncbi:purine-cytosine permease family protein [Streptomyces sp. NPDC090075]|uniref:purine-cytosine permease family protein n=1 Tax=Streptomyces sp. NPDC090075 TaxID=3365937 RepID=UPI003819E5AB
MTGQRVTQIEAHGIDTIPDAERTGTTRELFALWVGSNVLFSNLLLGGLLIALGLPLVTAVVLAVAGNVAWILVGLLATVGPKNGTATMVVSRAQYGYHGTKISCAFNWLVMIGYEGIAFSIAAMGTFSLADYLGFGLNTFAKTVVLLALIVVAFAIALFGRNLLFLVQKVAAVPLGVATVMFAAFLIPHVHWDYTPAATLHGWPLTATVLIGVSIVLSVPLAYTAPADVARYLPRGTSSRAVALATAVGGYVPTVALMVVGILAATAVDPSDFTTSMRQVLPGWFYPVFLLIVVVGTLANSIGAIYSAGLTLQTMGVRMSRPKTVWVDGTIGTAIAAYGVLVASNFLTVLQNFLLWSIFWAAPFFGIFIAELIASRGNYDAAALHQRSGTYWYGNGMRWRAVAALALGMTCSALFGNTPYLKGPLSSELLHGGDLSAVSGLLISGTAYWALCVLPARRSRTETPANDGVPVASTSAEGAGA